MHKDTSNQSIEKPKMMSRLASSIALSIKRRMQQKLRERKWTDLPFEEVLK